MQMWHKLFYCRPFLFHGMVRQNRKFVSSKFSLETSCSTLIVYDNFVRWEILNSYKNNF